MKNKKLLFGLFAAIILVSTFALASIVGINKTISIQPKQNNLLPASTQENNLTKSNSTTILDQSIFLGPTNLGGRVRALLIDKNNSNHLIAGTCGGGLWETTTGGTSWKIINDFNQNLIVTSITQAFNGDIYIGTGEGFIPSNGDMIGYKGFIGNGIYKLDNGGSTFNQLPSTTPTVLNDPNADWAYVNDVAYDNTNNKLYAATNKGLKVSDNNGISWSSSISTIGNSTQITIVGNIIATNIDNACYISNDGGNNFVNQSTGASGKLPNSNLGRVCVSISPSNNNHIYASIANSNGSFKGLYESTDAGNNWSIIIPEDPNNLFNPFYNNGKYLNSLAVFPSNENKVIIGGANLWIWEKNKTLVQISTSLTDKGDPYYIPYGQHKIVFNQSNDNIIYVANDMGVSKSIDGGKTYRYLYIGLASVPFYSVTQAYGNLIIGGTQSANVVGLNSNLKYPQNFYGFSLTNNNFYGRSAANVYASFLNTKIAFTSGNAFGSIYRCADYKFDWVDFIGEDNSSTASNKYYSVVPFSYWETDNDQLTHDTTLFVNSIKQFYFSNGDGKTKTYNDTITIDQPAAKIVPGSVIITSGTQIVVDDANGRLRNQNASGQDLGSIDYNTKIVNFTFLTAPTYGQIVEVKFNVRYNAGDVIIVKSYIDNYPFNYTLTQNLEVNDSIYPKDIIQSKFFVAAYNSVWMTRKSLDLTKPYSRWFKLTKSNIVNDSITSIQNSYDGDCVYYGTLNGKLFGISGIRSATDCDTTVSTGDTIYPLIRKDLTSALNQPNRKVNCIAVDPSNSNHIIVILGGYNQNNYIYESTNALTASPTFTSKQGNLPPMPVYSAIIEMNHPNMVILGTEYGVYSTEDISVASPTWVDQSVTGIPHVPVFMVRQQTSNLPLSSYIISESNVTRNDSVFRIDNIVKTTGKILFATYGRGVWANNTFKTPDSTVEVFLHKSVITYSSPNPNVNIFPNPTTNQASVYYNLTENSNVDLIIMDVQGQIIQKMSFNNVEGDQKVNIDCNKLKNGTYYVQIITNDKKMSGKFVVVK